MKIDSLNLDSFRNHHHTGMTFDHLNIILGRNGSGKSSIVYALEAALTGRCAATDKGGRGLDDLVAVGEKAARIQLTATVGDGLTAEDLSVERTISAKGSSLQVGEWTGGVRDQQQALMDALGADADLVSCLLNVSSFTTLTAKEQREMLVKIADVDMLVGELEELMGPDLYARWATDNNLSDADTITADDVERFYKKAYDARAVAKKRLAEAEGRMAGLAESAPADLPPADELPAMREQLAELERQLSQANEAKVSQATAAGRMRDLDARIGMLDGQITRLKAEKVELEETPYPAVKLEDIAAEAAEAEQSKAAALARASELAGKITGLDVSVKAIKKATAKCPVAPEVVKCPLSKEDRKDLVAKLEVQRVKLVAEHELAVKEITACSMAASELAEQLAQVAAGKAAYDRLKIVEAELAELTAELKAAGQEMAELAAPASTDDTDTAELARRIHDGHALIARMEAAQDGAGRADEIRREVDSLRALADGNERLVALFGPGPEGVGARMLAGALSDIQVAVSNALTDMTGGTHSVDIEADPWRVTVYNGRDTVELKHLSTSERFRVGIAFAVELARLAGLGLLVIDDAEVLDYGNRAFLSEYLDTLADFDTIILLSTQDDRPGELELDEDVARFWVEGGQVVRLEGAMV